MGFMEKTLSSQASDWREGRRLRAWELKQQGWTQREIARALGVTEGAVSQWMKRARKNGVEGLRKRTSLGAASRLSEQSSGRNSKRCWPREPQPMDFGARCGPARGWRM
jgi:transposase